MLAILLTTYFTSVFKMTLVFGVPFLLALSALYYLLFRKRGERAALRAGWSVHEACAGLAQGGQHGAGGPARSAMRTRRGPGATRPGPRSRYRPDTRTSVPRAISGSAASPPAAPRPRLPAPAPSGCCQC